MKRCLSETFGTFVLVFAGTGAIVVNDLSGGAIGHAGIALTFGLAVMVMILVVGRISGAHLNPAVTVALAVAGRFGWSEVPRYIAAQVVGACAASVMLWILFPTHETLGATLPSGTAAQSLVMELILGFILMFAILMVSAQEPTAAMAIGSVVALEAMFAGPVSGASMNPVRSLAPALISGHLEHLWLYLVAPVIGALLAVPFCICSREAGCCRKTSPSPSS